jgi:hypothetical protein
MRGVVYRNHVIHKDKKISLLVDCRSVRNFRITSGLGKHYSSQR